MKKGAKKYSEKKFKLWVIVIFAFLLLIIVGTVIAISKAKPTHVNFYLEGQGTGSSPWARLSYYSTSGFSFAAHNLPTAQSYQLISYDTPSAGAYAQCFGSGTPEKTGSLRLDGNTYMKGMGNLALVLASDVDCSQQALNAWNPSAYLFAESVV